MKDNGLKFKHNSIKSDEILIGCRIPKDFFVTKGTGESDITIHAGSYHLALKKAGIEMCNIMTYSSILPGIAKKINQPKTLTHGAVMETIMAVANVNKGERATVGIINGWLYDKKTNKRYGGLVCEYNGNLPRSKALAQLRESLNELFINGFSKKYDLRNISSVSKSFIPKKEFGTALVALCFVNYVVPLK
ncbi:MAG: pyruvoyl-dependent arginine decarboxylase [archaeon]